MNTDPNTENDQEAQLKANLERIRALRFIDDEFMNVCFDDYIEGTQLMLRIILNKPALIVTSVRTQKVLKNLSGRDIWLDIHAKDSTNAEFDIEVQRLESGADSRRARYHSSIMDAHLLEPGQDFKVLPDSYVIFITETDVLKGNKPLYCIERMMMELKQPFNDGSHIVYVNG
ncbi:MAG: PD-(D/E)XK nuclease family transposase, partial [Succinivibrio sp.]|nr:PD-(D/E)XK nuclease family transposase [Succinivibrio sp.]